MTSRRAILRLLSLGATLGPALQAAARATQLPTSSMSAILPAHLRAQWRTAPMGIDTRRPRFSWILGAADSNARNLRQRACRVVVASSAAAAQAGRGDVWDSGQHSTQQPAITPDSDLPLQPQVPYHWSVQVWDQQGRESPWSEPVPFITGMLAAGAWQAGWIASRPERPQPPTPPPADDARVPSERRALPLFRHTFTVGKPIQHAIACVSGLGQYELRFNGQPAGRSVLNPGWTDYRKTVLYNTLEVTSLLRRGANTIGVLLGNGMYNVENYPGRYTKLVGTFGQPKLILQLKLVFTDGSEQLIVSDHTWSTRPGPITLSQAYGGEDFDARLEPPGWDQPGATATGWVPAVPVKGPGGTLRAQNVPPVVVARTLTPVAITQPKPGVQVYDLGENFSGWPRIVVRGAAGSRVRLLPGELLDEAGLVTQRSANAWPGNEVSFSYTLGGTGEETWRPRFTYYGFRYVQVEGAPLVALQGEFLHADLPSIGQFDCSNPLLARIHQLITQALLSNTMSVLTDCPQREKLGWLEQTHLNADTVFYNEDAVTLYEKMLRDMQDAQLPNGMVPEIAPEYLAFLNADGSDSIFRDSPEWSAALVLSPWAAYRYTGETRILAEGYESMRRYVHYLGTRLRDGLLDFGLGDWYDIGPQPPGVAQLTSRTLTGTAIYCEVLLTLTRIAYILGHTADAARYSREAADATQTFNTRLFNPDTNQYDRGSMTANAMPLAIGLVPEAHRAAVLANLVADIRAHGNHVTAGDVGFHYVVLALMQYDRGDVLYNLLTRTDSPSYGYQLAQGATALTEAWDANPHKSQNHFMLGHAETWLYGGLAGLRVDFSAPAESRIRIVPQAVAGVTAASARYRSVWGDIVSAWRRENGHFELDVEIPPGASAQVELPAASGPRTITAVGSGRYRFQVADISPRSG